MRCWLSAYVPVLDRACAPLEVLARPLRCLGHLVEAVPGDPSRRGADRTARVRGHRRSVRMREEEFVRRVSTEAITMQELSKLHGQLRHASRAADKDGVSKEITLQRSRGEQQGS